MQGRTTVYARRMLVDLDDQRLGLARRCAAVVVIGAEGEIPVTVHGRDGHQKCIGMNVIREEADRLAERIWDVVHDLTTAIFFSLLDEVTLGLLYEHAMALYPAHQLIAQERALHVLLSVHVVELHVVDFPSLRARRERFH